MHALGKKCPVKLVFTSQVKTRLVKPSLNFHTRLSALKLDVILMKLSIDFSGISLVDSLYLVLVGCCEY